MPDQTSNVSGGLSLLLKTARPGRAEPTIGRDTTNRNVTSFSNDLDQALGILQSMQDELEVGKIDYTRRCAAISIYGPHFSERPAIAGTVFEAASEAGVEILLIATSFSTVTFLTHSHQADLAIERLYENFLVP